MNAKARIRLGFKTEKQVATVFNALSPETTKPSVTRSKVILEKEGTHLVLRVEATDTVALRAALNAYLRWISSLTSVLTVLENVP